MLEILEQEGRATNLSKATTTYPRGHDSTTPTPSAAGGVSSDLGDDPEQTGIFLDANLFDEKVRTLVEQAGGCYNFKAAVGAGLIKRVDPELLAAIGRLEKAAPLLNRAVEMAERRRYGNAALERVTHHDRTPASIAGSSSGSASGSVSGQVSKAMIERAMQGHQEDALALMGRR